MRGGYSLTFVNEETVQVAINATGSNFGLQADAFLPAVYTTVAAGVPVVPTPEFRSVRTTRTSWLCRRRRPRLQSIRISGSRTFIRSV